MVTFFRLLGLGGFMMMLLSSILLFICSNQHVHGRNAAFAGMIIGFSLGLLGLYKAGIFANLKR